MSALASQGKICCCCGVARRPTQSPVSSFGNNCDLVAIKDHRTIDATHIEQSPSMIVNVSVWRNGGGRGEHLCDECIVIGLQAAKRFVDSSLLALTQGSRE